MLDNIMLWIFVIAILIFVVCPLIIIRMQGKDYVDTEPGSFLPPRFDYDTDDSLTDYESRWMFRRIL